MTLRIRLTLVLIGVVASGLIISDAVTYTQLRSFLFARVDPQLQIASFSMSRVLDATNGIGPSLPFLVNGSPGSVHSATSIPQNSKSPQRAGQSANHESTSTAGAGDTGTPRHHFPGASIPNISQRFQRSASGLEPAGTVGELVSASGARFGKPVSVIYSGRAPGPLLLPHPLPGIGRQGYAVFSVQSAGARAVSYRAIVRPFHYHHLFEVVAIPTTDIDDTLGRLLLIELLVSGAVLIALGVLARLIVRRGLRPLDDMASVAGTIAGGENGRRVSPTDERTEVGRLGMALNSMLEEIEEAFRVRAASAERLRRFLADASHELRTPLTSIRGYSELFDLGAKTNPADVATSMHHIRDEAARMELLVNDLLLLARADRERPLELLLVDIVPLVEKAVAVIQLTTSDHNIVFRAPPQLMTSCDTDRFRQVIDNLLVNAIRHSPNGTSVEVTICTEESDVVLRVRDHGAGVSVEDTEAIFQPFHRSDFARARAEGGAGLGLAIVASIVHAHGGSVGVDRPIDGGAEFWVRLPPVRPAPASPVSGAPAFGETAAGDPASSGNSQERQSIGTVPVV